MENLSSIFIEEATGLLRDLENTLLNLEQNKHEKELIHEVFRVMHTLKGTSAMFGFDNIGALTHHLENIYDLARQQKLVLNDKIINVTLEITDYLKSILNREPDDSPERFASYIKKLEGLSDTSNITGNSNPQISENKEFSQKETSTYYIVFRPNEKIIFRGINICNIFRELSGIGIYKIVKYNPVGLNQENEAEQPWGIYLVTNENIEKIQEIFMFIEDDCEILKIAGFNLLDNEKFYYLMNRGQESSSGEILKTILEIIREIEESQNETLSKPEKNTKQVIHNNENRRISVDSGKLDKLMNLVSELITSNAMLNMISKNKDYSKLEIIAEKIERLTNQFRDNAISVRLVNMSEMMVRFKRLVRDISKDLGKDIRLIIEGEDTELDKNLIDNIAEPLMHILRNAADHGIETPEERLKKGKQAQGIIKLSAFYYGSYVYITVQDDGAGMDIQKIKNKAIEMGLIQNDSQLSKKEIFDLLFLPGFSTAKKVSEISGRGVGLDVVNKKTKEIQGEVEVESEPDLGTLFTIKLQQTISIVDSLLVKTGNSLFLIPQADLEFCLEERHDELFGRMNRRIEYESSLIPFISSREIFCNNSPVPHKEKLVVVNKNNMRFAIVVDEIIGEYQAVMKPLSSIFKNQVYLTGVSILGDGSLAFMLDLSKLQLTSNIKN